MSKIKILIADDNLLSANKLFDKLRQNEDFEIIGIAGDGRETIDLLEKERPDVVLLDIIMPKIDGFGVLEHSKEYASEYKPIFIIFSAISKENYITRAMNLGANYYIVKPFDETVIATRIRQLYSDASKKQYYTTEHQKSSLAKKAKILYDDELKVLSTKYIREYGLKPNMTGYCYIRDVIIVAFDCYCQTGAMPKGIYRAIASKNNVSVQKVERAIRNCIKNVLEDRNIEKKPTNSQVICELMEKIRINN
ncbi:MAG TPA: response regulator [Ruminiclostridium sp.]